MESALSLEVGAGGEESEAHGLCFLLCWQGSKGRRKILSKGGAHTPSDDGEGALERERSLLTTYWSEST